MILLHKLVIHIIKAILWLIDSDHRRKEEIASDDMKKFTHVQDVEFQSDFGRATKAFRTVPYQVWELKTTSKTLLAADKHRVIREDRSTVWLEDLKVGDRLITDTGIEEVLICRNLGIKAHMYCIEVSSEQYDDPNNHLYYSDGILSHNTTCAGAYLLWKALFVPDSTILVVGNILSAAQEILERVQFSYEHLPDFIRCGAPIYNKRSLQFDNGSRIICRATTKAAGRGLSLSLVFCDEFAFVAPGQSKEFWKAISPTFSTGGSCIITSTPKSDTDQFAQIWRQACDNTDANGNKLPHGRGRNEFFPIKVTWREHPDRGEEWARPYRETLGEAGFRQEMECVDGPTKLQIHDGVKDRAISIEELFNVLEMAEI